MHRYSRKYLSTGVAAAMVLCLTASMLLFTASPVLASSKLKVTPGAKTMYIGDTVTLKSNLKVKWSVSKGTGKIRLSSKKNKSVKVKALKAGSAVVKAGSGKKTKTVKITVRSRVPKKITIKVSRNIIFPKELSIASVKSVTPSYASKSVSWYSSDKSIATVNKFGRITGVSPGRVTITAKSKLNSKIKGSVTVDVAEVKSGTMTATIELKDAVKYPAGKTVRVWVPVPSSDSVQSIPDKYLKCDAPSASKEPELTTDSNGNRAFFVEWGEEVLPQNRTATVSFRVTRRETIYPDDLAALEDDSADLEEYAKYLSQSNRSGDIYSDTGIVKMTADRIVNDAGAVTVYDKAYAIYDWVLEHLSRDSSTPGLGSGDVEKILAKYETERIGKCTDVNSVFEALCRAEGIPARSIFGIKLNSSPGQKCKPQFVLPGYGWVDADPSEVLKQIKDHEDDYRGENAEPEYAEEWKNLKKKYWAHADAGWMMLSEGRDITLSPQQNAIQAAAAHDDTAAAADTDKWLNQDGTLNYFVFPYAEYDGKYVKCYSGAFYSYAFEEDEDCGC